MGYTKIRSFTHLLSVITLAPIWALASNETRKSWAEFVHGLIKHKHEWEEKPFQVKNYDDFFIVKWYRCKHFGCNTVHPIDERGRSGIKLDKAYNAVMQARQ